VSGKINYMLYYNGSNESLAYGNIKYITEHLRCFITGGKPENVDIRPTQSGVLRTLEAYNLKNSYKLNLFKHLETKT
jgi:hypothetical protein